MKSLIIAILFLTSAIVNATPAAQKNEDGSFKISEKSLTALGVVFAGLSSQGPWILPKDSIVKVNFTEGVYRRYEGDITFVIVKVLNTNGNNVTLTSQDLEAGDEVATKGTSFLRLAEADLNSGTVDACAH